MSLKNRDFILQEENAKQFVNIVTEFCQSKKGRIAEAVL